MERIDLGRLRQEGLKDICISLEAALQTLGIDYYLIGALARDVWFAQENIPSRRTSDVDFAILVPEQKHFEELKAFLSQEKRFTELKNNSFAMLSPNGTTVDILPFGSIEIDEELQSPGTLKVITNGLQEIYNHAVRSFETEEKIFNLKVASLTGIFLLKLIAFEDRPEFRIKDPGDMLEIIEHYFELHTDYIYENHSDIFDRERSLAELSCRVIGREIGNIVEGNSALKNRIQNYLSGQIAGSEKSSLFRLMQRSNDKVTIEDLVLYTGEILSGIDDKKIP